VVAPARNAVLATPVGESYPIEVQAGAAGTRSLASVSWRSPSQQLSDGVESLAVQAQDTHFTVRDLAHVLIRNNPGEWDFVEVEGTNFVHNGGSFRYLGFNEYELFTAPGNFGRNVARELDETISAR
jgi:hypothetical protein